MLCIRIYSWWEEKAKKWIKGRKEQLNKWKENNQGVL